ncbi:MAG: ABC transporter ATP-binding protein, partial [Bdellovibrionota bacterium]
MSANAQKRPRGLAKLREESSFLRHYLWKYRRLIGVGLLALIIVDLLEIFPPLFLKRAVDAVTEHQPVGVLKTVAILYLVNSLLQGVCRYAWRMYLIRAGIVSGRDIRARYAGHLFRLSASFFDRKRIGELMSLATSDVEAVRMAIGNGILVMADSLFYLATVPIAMYLLSPRLTILAMIPLPFIPWLVYRNEKAIDERYEKVQDQFARISAMVQEGLSGIRVVKAFAKEDALLARIGEAGEEFSRLNLWLARVQSSFGPTLDFTVSLGLVLLLYYGGGSIIGGAAITLGTFVAFQRYIQKMVWPMAAFGMAINFYQRSVTSSGRIKEILAEESDVPEAATPSLPANFQPGGAWKTAGGIEIRNLHFGFPNAGKEVLSGISLSIEPGERIALVGGIGSGKSALLSLLPRLYPVARGMLTVDGVDVNDWPLEELRRQMGYVAQEVFLFNESVLENLAFGMTMRTDGIENAAELASVHEEVLNLSHKYQTRLGERGVNLSGG